MRKTIQRMAVAAGFALGAIVGAGDLSAQVATSDARSFVGEWTVAVSGEAPSEFQLRVADTAGQLEVVVTSADGTVRPVEDVTKEGDDLVLRYTTAIQGVGDLPIVLTFTPDGAALTGSLDLPDVGFNAPVRATRR